MSQYTRAVTAGNLPVTVPTQITTNDGIAVPAAHNLNVFAEDSTDNNDNGIQTAGATDTVTIQLTNRQTGTVTTTDATVTTLITFPLGASGAVYSISGIVTVRVPATGDGASYDFNSAFRTDGVTASEIGTEYPTNFEDAALATADITVLVDGANNVLLRVQGVAATTINWDGYLTFRQVS